MNTTNTILIEEEPHLFDQANFSLNTRWIEWQMAKHEMVVDQAIAQGNEKLVKMIDALNYMVLLNPDQQVVVKQLNFTIESMNTYLRAFELFISIQQQGWIQRIKPSDPSVFATSGPSDGLRLWLHTIIRDHKLHTSHAMALGSFIIGSLRKVTRNQYEAKFGKKAPDLVSSSVPGIPNMLWVLHYALKKGCDLETAHIAGLAELLAPQGKLNA